MLKSSHILSKSIHKQLYLENKTRTAYENKYFLKCQSRNPHTIFYQIVPRFYENEKLQKTKKSRAQISLFFSSSFTPNFFYLLYSVTSPISFIFPLSTSMAPDPSAVAYTVFPRSAITRLIASFCISVPS